MKLNLLNTRLEYSREEMLKITNTLASASCIIKDLKLKARGEELVQFDIVLNKLICEVPDLLCIS